MVACCATRDNNVCAISSLKAHLAFHKKTGDMFPPWRLSLAPFKSSLSYFCLVRLLDTGQFSIQSELMSAKQSSLINLRVNF